MPRETTVLPSQDGAVLDAAEELLMRNEPVSLTVGSTGVRLPDELRTLLADVVRTMRTMRRGQALTFAPHSQQLTTQQAADLLGISRPTLIKLLEAGHIPYERPARHRPLRLRDVLSYQQARRNEQREALNELTRDAADLGLYSAAPEEFEAALIEARRKLA